MEIKTLSWGKVVNVDGSRFLGRNGTESGSLNLVLVLAVFIFNLHYAYFFFFGFRKEQFHAKLEKKEKNTKKQ